MRIIVDTLPLQPTTHINGELHITIPDHDPLRIGTLSAIITDIAFHFNKSKDDMIKELFG